MKKGLLGPSALFDVVILQFGHYAKSSQQSAALRPTAVASPTFVITSRMHVAGLTAIIYYGYYTIFRSSIFNGETEEWGQASYLTLSLFPTGTVPLSAVSSVFLFFLSVRKWSEAKCSKRFSSPLAAKNSLDHFHAAWHTDVRKRKELERIRSRVSQMMKLIIWLYVSQVCFFY